MLEQLKRPFKKRYDKVRTYAGNFVGPVKESASKLFAMLPKMEAFAGSEFPQGALRFSEADSFNDCGGAPCGHLYRCRVGGTSSPKEIALFLSVLG